MCKWTIRPLVMLVIISFLLSAAAIPARAQEGDADDAVPAVAMYGDAILIRPLGLAATILGAAVFVISLPFSSLGGNTQEAAQKLIFDPADYTFKRPLGKI